MFNAHYLLHFIHVTERNIRIDGGRIMIEEDQRIIVILFSFKTVHKVIEYMYIKVRLLRYEVGWLLVDRIALVHNACIKIHLYVHKLYNSDFFQTQVFFPGRENSLNEVNVDAITCTGLFSPPGSNKHQVFGN